MGSNAYELAAIDALRAWHRVAATEFPQNMKLSFDQFLAWVRTKPNWVLDFGKSVVPTANLLGVGMQGVIKSMEELARQSQGRVSQYQDGYPKLTEFFDALAGRALSWDVSVVKALAADTAVKGLDKAATAATTFIAGYGAILAISAGVGLYVLITSYRKRPA